MFEADGKIQYIDIDRVVYSSILVSTELKKYTDSLWTPNDPSPSVKGTQYKSFSAKDARALDWYQLGVSILHSIDPTGLTPKKMGDLLAEQADEKFADALEEFLKDFGLGQDSILHQVLVAMLSGEIDLF